ncbi:pentatricopeptide repeat-containing protein At1g80270, mitochondrial-like [Cucurbita pepo subsp. pepo]|uniref:pentatricopeptide repeat-containing protein At1g80270, mitochondrial-like n=1 Tax=Cucurbita pepo subsp. pepo TaxID=3664 RepID=UPI000C9D6386|nr:pentatricopeptide repeat-containing protein At1g80270, mitochondrial-like [Cucurbita pepo subsp. pepo]
MWAIRRASTPIRNQVFGIGASYTFLRLDGLTACTDVKRGMATSHVSSDSCLLSNWFHYAIHGPSRHGVDRRSLSSQAGPRSSGEEDDLEDGFSELEPEKITPTQTAEEDDMFIDPELIEDDAGDSVGPSQNDLDLSEAIDDADEKRPINRRAYSELFQAIMSSPGLSIHNVLDKWVAEGKELNRSEISLAMLNLRKRRLYGRALQLSEWLEANKQFDFIERDYASHIDLIAKVRGLLRAEHYVEKIPKSFRGETIYRTLLANCVIANNVKKAEDVFNKIKDLGFPITAFSCNQLLLLYKRHHKKKIADILLVMEKENVKPTLFTYKILVDAKGRSHDMVGMDQVIETMKADGIEPDINTQAIMVKHYAYSGLKERAVEVLKEIEGNDLNEKRWVCRFLLPLYGVMQMTDEVERIWNVCKSDPRIEECMSAIVAWGKVNNIEKAEAVFDHMLKTWKLSTRQYHVMLKVYADHKMLAKGKDLVKRMGDNGCHIGPLTWDAIVKLYVEAGDVEKADSVLQKAIQQKSMKPMQCSFMTILDQYAGRGDVHNAEKMFHMMREAGYVSRPRQFHSLLQAYINAKAPAYGMGDRMKADNININRALSTMLAQVSVFRKTAVSDLLD